MADRRLRYLWWTIIALAVVFVVAALAITLLQGPPICGDCNTNDGLMATVVSKLHGTGTPQ